MPAFQTTFEALPSEVPIFPLSGALLLPGGRLPLNIFEPRFLAMTEDALAAGRLFAMVQPDPALPRTEIGSQIYRVGCLGRISSFAETEDGRYLITLTGVIRCRVVEEAEMRRGYRRASVDYAPYAADLALDTPAPQVDRNAMLIALRPYFKARGIEANWEAVEATPDSLLVTTLCMLCPFEVREKQALLEAPTVSDRAAMLVTLLQMGGHAMAPEGRPS
ncbi:MULTISPECIES: LON peptidase substrate-binding domain-containing protein [Roseomonadaceae]|uniref:LON peptidase substrate-binding domain-containing protein n=1 Tax=Falsiroseomonas oleicola TaxID=2801474 RepID=A0ABS6H4Y2_9PROT|nr:LON peptidase substrate-binding domain-containing protein [Roseomonas oleicola]MBU8542798.1 LON peptidase substrate-binding domain-containing protein [Roseomonas oleicola]